MANLSIHQVGECHAKPAQSRLVTSKLEQCCVAGCTAEPDGESHGHAAQFLICHTCGRVVEMQDHDVSTVLARAAKEAGFTIANATIEAEGLCSTCRSASSSRPRSH